MAMVCATCGSADTQAGTDSFMCLQCRAHTGFDGVAVDVPVTVNLAPNLADLQRASAKVAKK